MSTSALFAAKKRAENSLRNLQLPTVADPGDSSHTQNGVLLLSLLQSRLNWTSVVFAKYRPDSIQQPKKATSTRKKWPNMRYLGQCTLELGPHYFAETSFYEAVRRESWDFIAKAAGVDPAPISTGATDAPPPGTNLALAPAEAAGELVYTDIVIEFKEMPNERFLFPKDIIVELTSNSVQGPFELLVSFLLPLDHTEAADAFFKDAKDKLALWGEKSTSEHIRTCAAAMMKPDEPATDTSVYQPVNMRMLQVEGEILRSLVGTITPPDIVREKMMAKMETLPVRTYLRLHSKSDASDRAVEDMVQRMIHVPEITAGPVLAEKKRNELLNAIKLGKRPRSEASELEIPKGKHGNGKDDGLRKCAYCSAKHTAMWRPGPAGSGTLCNGCGLLWKQGKVLKGAPVISKEEERRQARLQRQQERARLLAQEKERERLELEKQQGKTAASTGLDAAGGVDPLRGSKDIIARAPQPAVTATPANTATSRSNIGYFAAQLLHQQHQTPAGSARSLPGVATQGVPAIQPSSQSAAAAAAHALTLYSAGGIPLPTLSIDFGTMAFSHPNCGVTLIDGLFSIRLSREGFESTTVEVDKLALQHAQFEVLCEGKTDPELLVMTCVPTLSEPAHRFNVTLLDTLDTEYCMTIRFLEKLDPSGGAVVKRILERWLSTPAPPSKKDV